MNECVEQNTTAAFDVATEGVATACLAALTEPVRRHSRTIARLELRESWNSDVEKGSTMPMNERRDALGESCTRSVCVMDVDLDELRASIEVALGEAGAIYCFDRCELDTGMRLLTCSGRPVHLRPKVYRLLVHLLERRHRAVSRDELCNVVWNGRCVGNATVDSTVKTLRHAVGDDGAIQRVVRTLSGYGYRLVAPVKVGAADRSMRGAVSHGRSEREGLRIRLDDPYVRQNAA